MSFSMHNETYHKHHRRKLDHEHNKPRASRDVVALKRVTTTGLIRLNSASTKDLTREPTASNRAKRISISSLLSLLTLILATATPTLLFVFSSMPINFAQGLQQLQQLQPLSLSAAAATATTTSQSSYLLPGHNMENLRISEQQPVGTIVYQLKALDRSNDPNRKITYALSGDTFSVDEETGEVRLVKQLDRERQAQISTVITVLGSNSDSTLESRRRTVIVEDADDSWPTFQAHKSGGGGSINNLPNRQQHQYIYNVNISEQIPIGSIVLSELHVTDADEGVNAEMIFECRVRQSTNNACDHFSIESRRLQAGRYSITLKTKQLLDYERHQAYRLSLIARGKRPSPLTKGTPLEAEAQVNINLLNIQDEGPIFVNAPYSLSMPESLEPEVRLLKLIVQDGDLAPQRDLSVIVPINDPFRDYFRVVKDPEMAKIWYLVTNKTIDREDSLLMSRGGGGASNLFTINLLAAELDDSGEPIGSEAELFAALNEINYNRALFKRETVTVMILDLPDTAPLFVRSSSGALIEGNYLAVNLTESLATGSPVPSLDLAAFDLDQGGNSRFKLTLVDGELGPQASEVFALEPEIVQGRAEILLNIMNSSLLDYEDPSRRIYRFHIIASKLQQSISSSSGGGSGGAQQLIQKLDVQIQILDANDNWPEFERNQYVLSVPELSPPGTLVAQIRALDRDSGPFGQVSHILKGHGASKFKVVASEGKILVGDCGALQCLDYETQPSYSLTYGASDSGGLTRNVSVIINVLDVNDHAPKFSELVYKRELISDNLSSKQNYISPQLIVRARDDDGPLQGRNNITYRIRSSNLTGLDVEPNSGLVYISQPLDLDSIISSEISASSSLPASLSFLNKRTAITSVNRNNHLHLQQQQRRVVFEAEVVAYDNGTPPLNTSATILLVVKGNRDGAPQFKQDLYQAYVYEAQPVMKPFFQVQAIDPDDKDSQLRYSLGFDLNDLVAIDAQTGHLSFKQRVDFDDFKGTPYNVTVYATDNSRPYPLRASAIVSILVQDDNNKRPQFSERAYSAFLVQGRTRPGDVVLQVNATDPDLSARLNYSILTDSITINDRNGQQFALGEIVNLTSGYLAQLSTIERVKLVQEFKRLFAINSRTGAIEMRAEPDYSFAASVSLRLRVVDQNQDKSNSNNQNNNALQEDFAEATVFLQTHADKSPIFAPPWTIERREYNVSLLEELPLGTVIFSLLAKDPQTNARIDTFEKVYESDPRDFFRVDRSSGQVLINRRIDFEELQTKRLSLTVRALTTASDSSSSSSTATINIQIVDLNDNAPQFRNTSYHVAVSESISSAHEIVTVSAEDRDSNEFNQIYYSLSGGYSSELFQIHPRQGIVTLRVNGGSGGGSSSKSAKLDRDTEASYHLIATASDCNETTTSVSLSGNCKRSSVPIEITVLDENDNDPIFINTNKRGEYEATSSETISPGLIITQVSARDADEGLNGQLNYEIVRTDDRVTRLFKIDSDGYISASGSLSGMGRSAPYRLTVRAHDLGQKQQRQAYAILLLTINDVVENDGVPKFVRPRPDEVVILPESAGPSTFVYQVQAVDPDEESSGSKLMYKFSQLSDTFEIDPFEGVIKTKHRANFYLDRELKPNYTLIIEAHDTVSPQKHAHQVLTIKIGDINDNEPYFEREIDDPPLVLYVDEEVPAGSLLGTIQAVDKDIGQNALIGYDIIEGNTNNLFRLSWTSDLAENKDQKGGVNNNNDDDDDNNNNSEKRIDLNGARAGSLHENREQGNNACRIYSTGRLDRETRESYTLTIKASSMSKMRNQLLHLRDPLGGRNPFNQYNVSDLTKIRVTIRLVDINDNRPVFMQPNARSVVDSSADVYSQLMVVKAIDADASNSDMKYSILDAFYFSDSKFKPTAVAHAAERYDAIRNNRGGADSSGAQSMRYVFDVHPTKGILRNSVSLRPFTDGYFEVYIKADSSGGGAAAGGTYQQVTDLRTPLLQDNDGKCSQTESITTQNNSTSSSSSLPLLTQSGVEVTENCFVAVSKVTIFVTHQRETFRFVFNKTKLNDRLDEFKTAIQRALEELMFEPGQVQASIASDHRNGQVQLDSVIRAEKVYLNTFNTDFYEREDGSLDFSTITSCSQLVKFDDWSAYSNNNNYQQLGTRQYQGDDTASTVVPNQVVSYDDVLSLLKTLNATQTSRQQQQLKPSSLFSQYGLVKIERCLPDKTMYKMTLSERLALYFAALIALVSILLAFIVSKMRKNYEKNLKILQRSKYQYMGTPYA